jgi:alpha-1,3-rhamnosyl/mannosyltransferase
MEHLAVPPEKIHVIPQGLGIGDQAARTNPESRAESPCRVLYVGSIFNRRHVVDLIRAFAPIARAHGDASLDIVGDNRSYPREDLMRTINNEALQTQVRWHEYATEDQLRDLYAQARVFAFLSEYEGLGMTPLEALAAGVPPVLMDTPVARESCGDAAVYVPANDLPSVTRALNALLFDEPTRSRVLAAAPAALAKYSWPRTARDTLAVLEGSV